MSVIDDDLRAAVAAGVISEAQAAFLARLADERQGYREARASLDEPFELFKGFNEIFIVVGLSVLYAGWAALTGLKVFSANGASAAVTAFAALQLVVIIPMTMYFTVKRRMIAPSIQMAVFTALGGLQLGYGLATGLGLSSGVQFGFASSVTAVILAGYWYFFRIPFSLLLTGLAVFGSAISLAQAGGSRINGIDDLFSLTSNPSISLITLGLGLSAFFVALRFDMSDPHRVTRRAANGFWLHVLAAPAIVNSIALTLYTGESVLSTLLLFIFLVVMATAAIVIDRRSFLISGIGYMIALVFTVLDGGFGLIIFLIGLGLVLLGANWEKLRCWLLNKLPDFPGKDRLPPWQRNTKEA
jgi:hypothetical protein